MATQLILTSNLPGLGSEGDQVTVADGYARNFLLPKSLALEATPAALKRVESLKLLRTERERKELEEAQELSKKISKLTSSVELAGGEKGKVFGSITSADIASGLKSRGFEVDKKAILLDEPIKKTGNFEIPIKLHPQVTATFKLTVTSNAPAETTEESKDTKPKSFKGKPAKKAAAK
jgi:large subunit ribosomal protein L9